MKDSSAIIEAEGLTKVYAMGKVQVVALNDVSLTIPRGSFLGITGPSGSGKSTLLNLIGGLDSPTSGTIHVRGKTISQMSNEELARFRRLDVGMIFQSFNLIPSLTAVENVALPLAQKAADFPDDIRCDHRDRRIGLHDRVRKGNPEKHFREFHTDGAFQLYLGISGIGADPHGRRAWC